MPPAPYEKPIQGSTFLGQSIPEQGGSPHLLQLLDGIFLLAVDLLLLKGIGLQFPDPLFQAGHTLIPNRGTAQQLPFLAL